MKIKDLIGKTFCTIAQRDLRYKIEKINEFGKVVISLNGKPTHELSYQIPSKVVELFKNGTWILIEEEVKTPSIEEVQEYFKNVSKIACAIDGEIFDIEKDCVGEIHYYNLEYWIDSKRHKKSNLCVWNPENGYAKIVEKEESPKILENKIDEYIYNNDAEKRVEAENPNTRKIIEFPQQFTTKDFDFDQAYLGILREGEAWFTTIENSGGVFSKMPVSNKKMQGIFERMQENVSRVDAKSLVTPTAKEIAFDFEIQSTIQKIQQLLLVKGKEYRRNNNPYHNFEVAARKKNITPERALDGFLLKHLVSYDDMLNDIEHGVLPKIEVVEEKFNDIIVYFLIQKAQILNRINNGKS